MTASRNSRRAGIALAFMMLAVMALAPAAGAAGQDELSGWERTSAGRGELPSGFDNGQQARAGATTTVSGPVTSVEGLRGWEATTTATQGSTRVASTDSEPQSFPINTLLLYLTAGGAAILVAFGVSRMVRPNRRPPRIA